MLAFWQWQSNPPTTVVCPDTAFSLSLHQYWYMTVVLAPHSVAHHTILLSLTNCSCHVVPQYWFLSHTVWVVTTRCYSAQNAHQVRSPYNICTPNLSIHQHWFDSVYSLKETFPMTQVGRHNMLLSSMMYLIELKLVTRGPGDKCGMCHICDKCDKCDKCHISHICLT